MKTAIAWAAISIPLFATVQADGHDSLPARGEPRQVSAATLSPEIDYQARRADPVTHEVDFRAIVTPPHHCRVLRVWLPLPPTNAGQHVLSSELSTFPDNVAPQVSTEPVYGNKFAYFEFREPKGAQIIQHHFSVRVWELRWDVDAARVPEVGQWPASFDPYLKPQPVARHDEFEGLLQTLVPERLGAARDLRTVMDWVEQNITYDHVHASLQADANHAFEQRRGHCSDYHGLCATMGRALGYPARVTYGINLYPKDSPSHCKLEAFVPGHGWVSYDVSETQRLVGRISASEHLSADRKEALIAAARDRLERGFRENSWLLLTLGTDYDLAPPASRPVRIVRTIFAEADGEPLPEPDPANFEQREFSWMTAHRFASDVPFTRPFEDLSTLSVGPPEGSDRE